jgi:hypothetical protein
MMMNGRLWPQAAIENQVTCLKFSPARQGNVFDANINQKFAVFPERVVHTEAFMSLQRTLAIP